MAHMVFGGTPMVAQLPMVAMALQKHIMEHVKIQAEEQADAELQAMGEQQPSEVQQAMVIAHLVAQGMMRVQELSRSLSGGEEGPDPIVALKEVEIQNRKEKDEAEQKLKEAQAIEDKAHREEQVRIAEERIRSQERIAQARLDEAEARRNQQAQVQRERMQQQVRLAGQRQGTQQ